MGGVVGCRRDATMYVECSSPLYVGGYLLLAATVADGYRVAMRVLGIRGMGLVTFIHFSVTRFVTLPPIAHHPEASAHRAREHGRHRRVSAALFTCDDRVVGQRDALSTCGAKEAAWDGGNAENGQYMDCRKSWARAPVGYSPCSTAHATQLRTVTARARAAGRGSGTCVGPQIEALIRRLTRPRRRALRVGNIVCAAACGWRRARARGQLRKAGGA